MDKRFIIMKFKIADFININEKIGKIVIIWNKKSEVSNKISKILDFLKKHYWNHNLLNTNINELKSVQCKNKLYCDGIKEAANKNLMSPSNQFNK